MNNYYDTISESYDELHGTEQQRKFVVVKHFLRGNILDVGCGTGVVWKTDLRLGTSDLKLETWDVTGIDPSKELLKKAKHIKTVLGSGEELPFPDDSFDTVTCFTAIHNFDDYKKGLEEMKRVSKDVVIVTVLKKSAKREEIGEEITRLFKNVKVINDVTDDVYMCEK